MGKKVTQNEFIQRSSEIHKNKYDYSKVKYKTQNDRVTIICPIHGEFQQFAGNHIRGAGCLQCKGSKVSEVKLSKNRDAFKKRASERHKNMYDYSKVEYIHSSIDVCIICPKHGEFWQKPTIHLKGCGCPKCKHEKHSLSARLTTEQFIERAEKVHGKGVFDYSEVKYVTTHIPVTIKCRYGHKFSIKPCDHIHRVSSGCPICNHSKGEYVIMKYLEEHNIEYVTEYKIIPTNKTLFGRKYFRADFYLPKFNTIIEFHGEQHYRPCSMWNNSVEKFEEQQERDDRLREYCKSNNITLIEIPHTKYKSINRILSHKLNGFD